MRAGMKQDTPLASDVQALVEMGFTEARAHAALNSCGDLDGACLQLLEQRPPQQEPQPQPITQLPSEGWRASQVQAPSFAEIQMQQSGGSAPPVIIVACPHLWECCCDCKCVLCAWLF